MTSKLPNRIAFEDLHDVTAWAPPSVGSGGKVLSSAEKESRERQRREQEIIEDVDGDNFDFSPMTAEDLQAITEAAEKEGFDKGYKQGLSKGELEGKKKAYDETTAQANEVLSNQVSQLLSIAEALIDPIDTQENELEKTLLNYVVELTRQLLERELQSDSSQVLTFLQRAVQALPIGAENIKVMLNPDDLALVETYAQEHQKDWSFQSDPNMLPGGCRIETRESLVDYSMEHRFESLCKQFLNRQLSGDDEDEVESESIVVEDENPDATIGQMVDSNAPFNKEDEEDAVDDDAGNQS